MINGFYRNVRHNLVHDGIFIFNARNRFIVNKMTNVFIYIAGITLLVTFIVSRFQSAQVVSFRTGIFAGCETKLTHAFNFAHQCFCGQDDAVFLGCGKGCKCSFCLSYQVISILYTCFNERRVSLLGQLVQTAVKHAFDRRNHVVHNQITHVVLLVVRHYIVFVEQIYDGHLLFLVFCHGNDRFIIVGHREVFTFCSVGRHFNRREQLLDFCFNAVHIDVAHYHDTLLVWTVPFLIIVSQCLVGEVVYHFHCSDRQTVGILAVFIHGREYLFIHTHHGSCACTPFFMDNSTFLVDFFRSKCQVIGPVVQNQQTRVYDSVTDNRYVRNVVHGFIY